MGLIVTVFLILVGYIIFLHFRWEARKKKLLTKLEEGEHQLVHLEKMATLGSLCAGIAHEINNPLTFLIANLSVLPGYVKEMDKKEEVQQILQECLEGANRIKVIVQDVLSLSRRSEERREAVDINQVLETTLRILWNQMKYKVTVIKDYRASKRVFVDPTQLCQVFLNIINNAIQAIKEKGIIRVNSFEDDKFVYVRISDTGEGIAPDQISKIFTPFYSTRKGIGLGLAIVNNIVKKYGGKIEVDSKQGEGTTFTVKLPSLHFPQEGEASGKNEKKRL